MALKLLGDAKHDRSLSMEELRRLEGLFEQGYGPDSNGL